MFDSIVLHGGGASLAWGYRDVVVFTSWRIARTTKGWRLSGVATRVDRFQCSQAITRKELKFTAPRAGGFWCWPVHAIEIAGLQINAELGQPLQ